MAYAIVRLRGKTDLSRPVADTMRMLRLTRQNHCVVLPEDATTKGMLNVVKDHVTWGEVDAEVLAKLLLRRGRAVGDRPIDDAFVKAHSAHKSIWDLSQAIAKGEAITRGLGPLGSVVWPPVDLEFTAPPRSLAVSPRDRIELRSTTLLRAGLTIEQSLLLQQSGLGAGRRFGCGLFIPHKDIADLRSRTD